jgi:hypothetical protein
MGIALGLIPKLIAFFLQGVPLLPETHSYISAGRFSTAWLNFFQTLTGDALFARAAGEIHLPLGWVFAGLFLLVLGLGAVSHCQRRLKLGLFLSILLAFLGTWAVTPEPLIGSRVWLLPLWLVPGLIAVCLSCAASSWRVGLTAGIVALNLISLSENYFRPILRTGGMARESVDVGGRTDNSWDFVDMRPLAEKLSRVRRGNIIIEDHTVHRLAFLLPRDQRRRVITIDNESIPRGALPTETLIVHYRTEERGDQPPPIQWGTSRAVWRRDLSTRHHDVFEVVE